MIENNHSINSVFDVMKYCTKEYQLDARMGPKAIIQTFSRRPVTKQDISTMKSILEEEGLIPFNSGEFGVTSLLEKKKFLSYVDFNDDFTDYTMVEKDESMFSNKEVFEQYVKEYKIYIEKENADLLGKKLQEFGHTLREPSMYDIMHDLRGEPLNNLDDYILDIPEINDFLAEGSYLIFYDGLVRYYVNSPCDMRLAIDAGMKTEYEIFPLFYKTYYPFAMDNGPCERLPSNCWFEKIDGDQYLTVNDTNAYIKVMERVSTAELNSADFRKKYYEL
ncbi:MAG: hypothetical protein Q8M39_05020 [Sulfuricurvum sp.]|nr:hypothetical protein [Sulfuricurvum sp.]